jgi:hypothetical protein
MRKIDEADEPGSCFNKARAEEPVFVLRAKDPLFPEVVRTWANIAETYGCHEPEKIAEARKLADDADEYRRRVHPEKRHPAEPPEKAANVETAAS